MTSHVAGEFDVIILGSGFTAGLLGLVLARNAARVLIVEPNSIGAFAAGENTIPYVTTALALIADRYSVPEIHNLARFERVQRSVAAASGRSKCLGFVYHGDGNRDGSRDGGSAPQEALQFNFPAEHAECHFYRPDVDAYLCFAAARQGAVLRERSKVADVELAPEGVRISLEDGEQFAARYLIDASESESPLAARLGIGDEPQRFKHRARLLCTHMVGVAPFETCAAARDLRVPAKWSSGALHHIFAGGWLGVFPFDNHPRAVHSLCSVGLTLDPAVFPATGAAPEEEFREVVARYPAVAEQFAKARTVRAWHVQPRREDSRRRCVGDRYCILDRGAFGDDMLFAQGLASSANCVFELTHLLLAALADGDFSRGRFASLERFQQGLATYSDTLHRGAAIARRDARLWDAYARLWLLGSITATLSMQASRRRFRKTGDVAQFSEFKATGEADPWLAHQDDCRRLMTAAQNICRQVDGGGISAGAAADQIFALLNEADCVPPFFGFGNPRKRYYRLSLSKMLKTARWLLFRAPPEVRRLVRAYVG